MQSRRSVRSSERSSEQDAQYCVVTTDERNESIARAFGGIDIGVSVYYLLISPLV